MSKISIFSGEPPGEPAQFAGRVTTDPQIVGKLLGSIELEDEDPFSMKPLEQQRAPLWFGCILLCLAAYGVIACLRDTISLVTYLLN